MDKIDELRKILKESKSVVFFGGAGMSTESGVPDFRSANGIYSQRLHQEFRPEEMASHSFFVNHTEAFFEFYREHRIFRNIQPNAGHKALAELERRGHLSAVITQNIDGLHQKAGSRHVIELHGTVLENSCMRCGRAFPTEKIAALKGKVPLCPHCGGRIKPHVVLYEEQLPESAISDAVESILAADLLIIGGTSLTVYPAAGFVRYYKGRDLVLINRDETAVDGEATLLLREPIGAVFANVMRLFE